MDEDRYYNLGSHDKLFNQIDELTDALASRDAEIESLRQQLADMTKERDKAKAMPMKYRRMEFNAQLQNENESLRQQLLSSQKREVMLRYAISWCRKITVDLDIHDALDHALSATTDIDGLILCHAELAAIVYRDYGGNGAILQTELADDEPLYRTKGPK